MLVGLLVPWDLINLKFFRYLEIFEISEIVEILERYLIYWISDGAITLKMIVQVKKIFLVPLSLCYNFILSNGKFVSGSLKMRGWFHLVLAKGTAWGSCWQEMRSSCSLSTSFRRWSSCSLKSTQLQIQRTTTLHSLISPKISLSNLFQILELGFNRSFTRHKFNLSNPLIQDSPPLWKIPLKWFDKPLKTPLIAPDMQKVRNLGT